MAETALVVEDLHKRFGDLEVLKGVSVTAHVGDVIAMIGSSGSGKSTLLRCINLLETPDSGDVSVAGETIRMQPSRKGNRPADQRQVDRIRASSVNVLINLTTGPGASYTPSPEDPKRPTAGSTLSQPAKRV